MRDGARAIAFYRNAFGAEEVMRFNDPTEDVSLEEVQRRMTAMHDKKPE